jgi:hypothetical protein
MAACVIVMAFMVWKHRDKLTCTHPEEEGNISFKRWLLATNFHRHTLVQSNNVGRVLLLGVVLVLLEIKTDDNETSLFISISHVFLPLFSPICGAFL